MDSINLEKALLQSIHRYETTNQRVVTAVDLQHQTLPDGRRRIASVAIHSEPAPAPSAPSENYGAHVGIKRFFTRVFFPSVLTFLLVVLFLRFFQ